MHREAGVEQACLLLQDRFGLDDTAKASLSWHVPVVAATLGGEPTHALVNGKAELTLAGCGTARKAPFASGTASSSEPG